jgi:hypothetical protein
MSRNLVVKPQAARHVTVHRGVEEATMSCNPRCAGVPNPTADGAVAPVNANQQAAQGAIGAATNLNPLAGIAGQAGGEEGAGASDPAQLLQGIIDSGLLGGGTQQQSTRQAPQGHGPGTDRRTA